LCEDPRGRFDPRDATPEFSHVGDVGLAKAPDPIILDWAAAHGSVLQLAWPAAKRRWSIALGREPQVLTLGRP
jgi:hypothetical protein